ncbi:hypothetical protein OHQ87_23690 [Micromonospora sp. NBC_00421]
MLSLVGGVAARDGEPVLHVHAVLGRPDGGHGGRRVRSTLEAIVTEVAPELTKRVDPETGLALITGPVRWPACQQASAPPKAAEVASISGGR